jgi:hypothetical protein
VCRSRLAQPPSETDIAWIGSNTGQLNFIGYLDKDSFSAGVRFAGRELSKTNRRQQIIRWVRRRGRLHIAGGALWTCAGDTMTHRRKRPGQGTVLASGLEQPSVAARGTRVP